MALIAVSGQTGCRVDEVARISAQRLGFELVTPSRVRSLIEQEFGWTSPIPDKAYADALASIVARLAIEHHLMLAIDGAELLVRRFPGMLRIHITAPESVRVGNVMLDRRLDRPAAKEALWEMEAADARQRKERFGKAAVTLDSFDLMLNAAALDADQMVELIETAVRSLAPGGARLSLRRRRGPDPVPDPPQAGQTQDRARRRSRVSRGKSLPTRASRFSPTCWIFTASPGNTSRAVSRYSGTSDGNVIESFTPDFYLPEFDLYVELTTMKQSLVTKKNRKVRLLRELYPHLNIQVFYQKDFENLIFKYGLAASGFVMKA